ncbi:hypothetical protein BMB171_C2161 [Bacillus thuringiensis BMB171]|nr:hypothetical protein BMB171_C2161 [Bacillus thuringiensis BMB171]
MYTLFLYFCIQMSTILFHKANYTVEFFFSHLFKYSFISLLKLFMQIFMDFINFFPLFGKPKINFFLIF